MLSNILLISLLTALLATLFFFAYGAAIVLIKEQKFIGLLLFPLSFFVGAAMLFIDIWTVIQWVKM